MLKLHCSGCRMSPFLISPFDVTFCFSGTREKHPLRPFSSRDSLSLLFVSSQTLSGISKHVP